MGLRKRKDNALLFLEDKTKDYSERVALGIKTSLGWNEFTYSPPPRLGAQGLWHRATAAQGQCATARCNHAPHLGHRRSRSPAYHASTPISHSQNVPR